MRVKITTILASAAFLAGTALTMPAFAANTAPHKTLKQKLAAHRAEAAFNNLSTDGQNAIADVLAAHLNLVDGDSKQATALLKKAQAALGKAASADSAFTTAMNQLNPKLKLEIAKQQQAAANKGDVNPSGTTKWIPVGAEIVAVDKLTSAQKSVVAKANSQLRAGDTKSAAQTLRIVGQELDFVIALAPLEATTEAVNRAEMFAEQGQVQEALDAINTVTNGIVFLSENTLESNNKKIAALTNSRQVANSTQNQANAAQKKANAKANAAQNKGNADAQANAAASAAQQDANKAQQNAAAASQNADSTEAGLAPGAPADTDPDNGPEK